MILIDFQKCKKVIEILYFHLTFYDDKVHLTGVNIR